MAVIVIRLDKYLADMGIGTRSEVKKYIRQGIVMIDGVPAKKPEEKVNIHTQCVTVRGEVVGYQEYAYYMLHKPAGVVSATEDKKDKTVLDLINDKKRKDLFPVGRLDKDTEGLLLITNDGSLAHELLSPKKHVDKVYFAEVEGVVTEAEVKAFAEGVDIGEEKITKPAKLVIKKSADISEIELTIQEGKFHQVKRMFEAVGMKVVYLKRLSMGSLVLDDTLACGCCRELTEEEIEDLKKQI